MFWAERNLTECDAVFVNKLQLELSVCWWTTETSVRLLYSCVSPGPGTPAARCMRAASAMASDTVTACSVLVNWPRRLPVFSSADGSMTRRQDMVSMMTSPGLMNRFTCSSANCLFIDYFFLFIHQFKHSFQIIHLDSSWLQLTMMSVTVGCNIRYVTLL